MTDKCRILIASQSNGWTKEMLLDLASYKRFKEIGITVRMHPTQSSEYLNNLIKEKGWKNVVVDLRRELYNEIRRHNFVITVSSTVGLQTILTGRLLIVYDTKATQVLDSIYRVVPKGMFAPFFVVKKRIDLHKILDDYLEIHEGFAWKGDNYEGSIAVL